MLSQYVDKVAVCCIEAGAMRGAMGWQQCEQCEECAAVSVPRGANASDDCYREDSAVTEHCDGVHILSAKHAGWMCGCLLRYVRARMCAFVLACLCAFVFVGLYA